MKWWIWFIIIVIIVAILSELWYMTYSKATIPVSIGTEELYEVSFPDGSALIIYTADHPKESVALEKGMAGQVKQHVELMERDGFFAPSGSVRLQKPSRTIMHGIISYLNESWEWLKDSLDEFTRDPIAVIPLSAGAFIRSQYMAIKLLFTYTTTSRNAMVLLVVPRHVQYNSMAEKAKIVDFIKEIRIISDVSPKIRKIPRKGGVQGFDGQRTRPSSLRW